MDTSSETGFPDPIVVTGIGSVVISPASRSPQPDVLPWLRSRKTRKFMGLQDQLAVIAAGLAAQKAGLSENELQHKTGVYLCVGYIPFEREDIEAIARNSILNGEFSMERFSTAGFDQVNPLLTFRCLPNMPIFHVSLNLGIQGPYFITYPGPGQFYLALEQACFALQSYQVDFALVGGVADQNNFLVQHHFSRTPGLSHVNLIDAAGFLCLQRYSESAAIRLHGLEIEYDPNRNEPFHERFGDSEFHSYLGPASLPVLLNDCKEKGNVVHSLTTTDGIKARSDWEL